VALSAALLATLDVPRTVGEAARILAVPEPRIVVELAALARRGYVERLACGGDATTDAAVSRRWCMLCALRSDCTPSATARWLRRSSAAVAGPPTTAPGQRSVVVEVGDR
jgi:hypothetical protein